MGETSLKDLALIGVLILGAPFIIQAVKGIGGFFGGAKTITDTIGGVAGEVYSGYQSLGGGQPVPNVIQQHWGLQPIPEGTHKVGAVNPNLQELWGLRETSRPDTPRGNNKKRRIPPRPALPVVTDIPHDITKSRILHSRNPEKSIHGHYKLVETSQGTTTIQRSGR